MMARPDLRIVAAAGVSPMELADGIRHYLQRKAARGARPNTIAAYRSDLTHYTAFVERLGQGLLVAVQSQHHVTRFLDDQAAQGIAPRSQARRLSALRMFFQHARREGWIGHDPTADEQVRFRATRVIAPELPQLHALIDAIPRSGVLDIRDRALLRLALDTGMRISEAASLDLQGVGSQAEIDLQRGLAHVVGKGGDTETLCFNTTTARMVEEWLAVRGDMAKPGINALFVTQRGTRPSRMALHEIVKRRGASVGLPEIHWHLLRHRRGAMVIEACGDKVGQQFLRHASLATTSEYGRHANNATFALLRERADLDAGRKSA
jgi:integrase/recombinase XerC